MPRSRTCQRCHEREPRAPRARLCQPCHEPYSIAGEATLDPRKARAQDSRLRRVYGITREDYLTLLASQGGGCAICQGKPRARRLSVDHDHGTGEVRGLLCHRCNADLLGAADHSADRLERAVRYMRHPPARGILKQRAGVRPSSAKRSRTRPRRRAT